METPIMDQIKNFSLENNSNEQNLIRIGIKKNENLTNVNNYNKIFNKQDYNNFINNQNDFQIYTNNTNLKNNGNIENNQNSKKNFEFTKEQKENVNSENSAYIIDDMSQNFTREEVIHKCSNIFFNFSKLDKKEKQFFINITNIKKIFKTVNLIDEKTLKSSDIDILTKKINPNINKFTEKNFLDLIVMIAARIYPKDYAKNPKTTVDNLVSTFFEPFSKHIDDKDVDLNDALKLPYMHRSLDLLITKFLIDYKLIALVNNILFAVKEIYKNYFNLESLSSKNYTKIVSESQNNLISFCKDFQILPFMINQDQLVIYFDLIIKTEIKNLTNNLNNPNENENYESFIIDPKKDMGTVFTLSRFCTSLIHFSIFSFTKNNQLNLNNINDYEKFLLFLEKLENSKGFQNFEKKSNRPHTNKLTLIPNKSVLKMINSQLLEAYDFFGDEPSHKNNGVSENNLNNTTLINQSQKILSNDKILKEYNEKSRNNEEFDLKNLLNLTEDIYESLINSRIDSLKDLFLRYAKLGEKLNTAKISLSSFIKFLKDCGVLPVEKDKSNKTASMSKNTSGKIQINTSQNFKNSIPNSPLSKTPTKATKGSINSLSKSPLTNRVGLKDQYNNINLVSSQLIGNEKKIKTSTFYGPGERKLTDSDINVIYSVLMGPKNLDNSGKIKHQFDKNAGFSLSVNDISKYPVLDKSIHVKSSGGIFNGKMDFFTFIKSFELVANKLFPELRINNAMQKLFSEYLNKLLNTNESIMASRYMQEIIERVKTPEMKDFLTELYNYLIFHYQNYSDNNGYMSFEQLFDFYKDFAIFPDIITLIQIKTIFNSLSDYLFNETANSLNKTKITASLVDISESKSFFTDNENRTKKKLPKRNFINYPLFLESLAITAMTFKFNEKFSDIDKILYLIERMNQSKGINCSQFRCGNTYNASKDLINFLNLMKEKYPEFYSMKMNREESKGLPIRFDEIY